MRRLFVICLFVVLVIIGIKVWADQMTITSYYPAPYGVYRSITTYEDTYLALNANERVGIGDPTPTATLDVDGDLSVRIPPNKSGAGSEKAVVWDSGDKLFKKDPDIAEYLSTSEPVEPGDLISIDISQNVTGMRSQKPYDRHLIGAVSTLPAIVMEESKITISPRESYVSDPTNPAVTLAGRIPLKVCAENGPINIGDPITSSSIPGVGMRATKLGRIVGYALQAYKEETTAPGQEGQTAQPATAMIRVFINPGYYIPEEITGLSEQLNKEE